MPQIDAIFSKARNGGYEKDIRALVAIRLRLRQWADKPISLYGRDTALGQRTTTSRSHARLQGRLSRAR
jgi:hypothetical protein